MHQYMARGPLQQYSFDSRPFPVGIKILIVYYSTKIHLSPNRCISVRALRHRNEFLISAYISYSQYYVAYDMQAPGVADAR